MRSRAPGILGTRVRGNANFMQERGNAEHEGLGTLNSHDCAEMTGAPPSLIHWVKQDCPSAVVKYGPVVIIPPLPSIVAPPSGGIRN